MAGLWVLVAVICLEQQQQGLQGCLVQQGAWAVLEEMQMAQVQQGLGFKTPGVQLACLIRTAWA
jgi:hypothetical protein